MAPLDPEFLADAPYEPEALLIDELLLVDRAASRVVARMPTHADLPLTRLQRVHPVRHPRHVNGGLMVHATAMTGMIHSYYCFDLRHADGWIGYGARARNIKFKSIARVGEPIDIDCISTGVRRTAKNLVARYTFTMTQAGVVVYESEQTGMFMKIDDETPAGEMPPSRE